MQRAHCSGQLQLDRQRSCRDLERQHSDDRQRGNPEARSAGRAAQHGDHDHGDEHHDDARDHAVNHVDGSETAGRDLQTVTAQRPGGACCPCAPFDDQRAAQSEHVRGAGGGERQLLQPALQSGLRAPRSRGGTETRDVDEDTEQQQRVGEVDHHHASGQPVLHGERSQHDLHHEEHRSDCGGDHQPAVPALRQPRGCRQHHHEERHQRRDPAMRELDDRGGLG